MMTKLFKSLTQTLLKVEDAVITAILRKFQPGLCIAQLDSIDKPNSSISVKDIWKDGFLWGVPKHRRSIEKRLSRKFGWPKYNWKPLVPKTNLLMCRACGHYYEAHTICGTCYKKVKEETLEIQKAMEQELKLDPVKDDIVVLYEGEREQKPAEFWKGQRIVELPKKRPAWFHPNLLEPTTQPLSDSTEVKPNDLA
ncbi:large ribosomal subunit protein bL32m [Phymastichus coffea]|uniref:large ribosomal subunit protein bL32m n=1 Tax=Phymastichus coffea TaxID=108790 RepID=UPI00273C1DD3|nr:large ribosomal subunit protein bL32m [Phymastichus coffea]